MKKNIQTAESYKIQKDKMAFMELLINRKINIYKQKVSDLDEFLASIQEENMGILFER